MNAPLAPCPSCHRHVQVHETACPFCAAPLGALAAPSFDADVAPRRVTHIALALGASLALGACPSPTPAAVYGAPPPPVRPAVTDADAAHINTPPPPPGPAPVYGAPPPLQAQPRAPTVDDDGGRAEVYGAPPAPPRRP